MIAPVPIPAPVVMTEQEALSTLWAIAKIHRLVVNQLGYFPEPRIGHYPRLIGYGVLGYDGKPPLLPTNGDLQSPTWIWTDNDQSLGWRSIDSLGRGVVPLGRIDRGLGAK